MTLRGFRDSDAAAVHALIYRTIDECYSGVYPPRAVEYFKRFHSFEAVRARVQPTRRIARLHCDVSARS